MTTDDWFRSARAAWAASHRLMLVLVVLVAVPICGIGVILGATGFGWGIFGAAATAGLLFALSVFAHEFAHAATHCALARRAGLAGDVIGIGTAGQSAILRFSLGPRRDALVSAAGPGAGIAAALPLLAPSEMFLVTGALAPLFLVHMLSLAPRASDGRQLYDFLKGTSPPC